MRHGGDDATETPPPPVAKRSATAGWGGGAVILTNICTRSRLSASAGLVTGFDPERVWRELAEANELFEAEDKAFRAVVSVHGAAQRLTGRPKPPRTAHAPEVPADVRKCMCLPPPNV